MKKFLNCKLIPAVFSALFLAACNDSLEMSEFKDNLDTQIEVGVSLEDVEKPVLSKIRSSNKREGAVSETTSTYANGTFDEIISDVGEEKFFALPYHTNSVWVYVECSDDAGIEYISCKEQLLYTVDGINVSDKTALSCETKLFAGRFLKGSGSRSAVAEYNFASNIPDGIVELSFTAVDYAGRKSDTVIKTACVKDTYVDGYAGVYPSMDAWSYNEEDDASPADWDQMDLWARHLYANEPSADKFATYNGKKYTSGCDNTVVDVYTGYSEDSLKLDVSDSQWIKIDGDSYGARYTAKKFEWDTSKELYIKTVTHDVCGNVASSSLVLPALPALLSVVNDAENNQYVLTFERKVYECGVMSTSSSADYWYFYWNEDGGNSFDNFIESGEFDDYKIHTVIKNPDSSKTYTARLFTDDSHNIMSPVYRISSALTASGTDSSINNLFTYENSTSKKNTGCFVLDFKFNSSLAASSGYEKFYVVAEYTCGAAADKVTNEVRTMVYDRTDSSDRSEVYLPADWYYNYSVKVYGIKNGCLYVSEEFKPSFDKVISRPALSVNIRENYTGKFNIEAFTYPSETIDNLVDNEGYYYIKAAWSDLGGDKTRFIKSNTKSTFFSLDSLELAFGEKGSCVAPCTVHFELSDIYGNTTTNDQDLTGINDIVYTYHLNTDPLDSNAAIISYSCSDKQELINTKIEYFAPASGWNLSIITGAGGDSHSQPVNGFYTSFGNQFVRLTGIYSSIQEPQYFYADKNIGSVYGFISNQSQTRVSFVSGTPVYVHTIYSAMDRGLSVREWERWCPDEQKVNRKTYTSSGAYVIDESDIPEGMYYRVVVHFADGTADISDVYKKEGQE